MANQEIWKYELNLGRTTLHIPMGGQVLCMQTQFTQPCIWVLVYPDEQKEERYFEVYGTGHKIQNDIGVERKYIGTYQAESGLYIFHVFERIN